MRISERKRQLREGALTEPRGANHSDERPVAAARPARARATPVRQSPRPAARKPGTQRPTTQTRVVRKQRGPRFYAGFGIVGIFFSLILVQSTISNYNSQKKAYPAAYAKYLHNRTTYQAALTHYHAALAHHVHPIPKAPIAPVAPAVPTLSLTSFALPILYIALSLAYLYLAYRASRKNRRSTSDTR